MEESPPPYSPVLSPILPSKSHGSDANTNRIPSIREMGLPCPKFQPTPSRETFRVPYDQTSAGAHFYGVGHQHYVARPSAQQVTHETYWPPINAQTNENARNAQSELSNAGYQASFEHSSWDIPPFKLPDSDPSPSHFSQPELPRLFTPRESYTSRDQSSSLLRPSGEFFSSPGQSSYQSVDTNGSIQPNTPSTALLTSPMGWNSSSPFADNPKSSPAPSLRNLLDPQGRHPDEDRKVTDTQPSELSTEPTFHRHTSEGKRTTTGVSFADVAAHTAKCDECDHRNKDGMIRCTACGWQCCRSCLKERRGDRSHHSFRSEHVPEDNEGNGRVSPLSRAASFSPFARPMLALKTTSRAYPSARGQMGGSARNVRRRRDILTPTPTNALHPQNTDAEAREAAEALVSMSDTGSVHDNIGSPLTDLGSDISPLSSSNNGLIEVDSEETLSMFDDVPTDSDSDQRELPRGERPVSRPFRARLNFDGFGNGEPRRNPKRESRPNNLTEQADAAEE